MLMEIIIPENLISKFLGTLILDTLHDAKGNGILYSKKLRALTDLLVTENNNEQENMKKYIFWKTFEFLWNIWKKPESFGLTNIPDFTKKADYFYNNTLLPIRLVAERIYEDTFITIPGSHSSPESINYHNQKYDTIHSDKQLIIFHSPCNDWFENLKKINDIVKNHCKNIVLDMKSSAGLLRSITDPIGYITGLPTFADPGFMMPGMSAIRKASEIDFKNDSKFKYSVVLEISKNNNYHLFTIEYKYSINNMLKNKSNEINNDNLCKKNLSLVIDSKIFNGGCLKASKMAEILGLYLSNWDSNLKHDKLISKINNIQKAALGKCQDYLNYLSNKNIKNIINLLQISINYKKFVSKFDHYIPTFNWIYFIGTKSKYTEHEFIEIYQDKLKKLDLSQLNIDLYIKKFFGVNFGFKSCIKKWNDYLELKKQYDLILSFVDITNNARTALLSKFTGDFGQLMWSIQNGHAFATEDNNTSAMALIMHQLPKTCFSGISNQNWTNIHGLGDGSAVEICFTKYKKDTRVKHIKKKQKTK